MTRVWIKPAVTMVAGMLLSASALAAVDGYYTDVGFGWSYAAAGTGDTSVRASSVDKTGMGFKVGMGLQVNQNFAVEGNYLNLGSVKYKSSTDASDGTVKTSALMANIKGILPLADVFSANVKTGLFRSFVTRDSGMNFTSSDKPKNRFGLDYGLGLQYDINPYFGLGLSWIQLLQDQNNSLLSADLSYHFG
jgi:opacity protein-like surface antigen